MSNQKKVNRINRNNSQGPEGVVELQKTQKEKRFGRHNSSETVIEEKKGKIRAFPVTEDRVEWLDRLIGGKRHCWRRRVAKQCLKHQRTNFSVGLEIDACRRVEKCFPTRLLPEGRSERDALVGVLIIWNGGCRKKLSATGCSDGGCGFREAS